MYKMFIDEEWKPAAVAVSGTIEILHHTFIKFNQYFKGIKIQDPPACAISGELVTVVYQHKDVNPKNVESSYSYAHIFGPSIGRVKLTTYNIAHSNWTSPVYLTSVEYDHDAATGEALEAREEKNPVVFAYESNFVLVWLRGPEAVYLLFFILLSLF